MVQGNPLFKSIIFKISWCAKQKGSLNLNRFLTACHGPFCACIPFLSVPDQFMKSRKYSLVSWTWCRSCASSIGLFKQNRNYNAVSLTIQFLWFGAQNRQGCPRPCIYTTWGASVLWGGSFGLADITEAYTGFSKFSFSLLPTAVTCRRRRKINFPQTRRGGQKENKGWKASLSLSYMCWLNNCNCTGPTGSTISGCIHWIFKCDWLFPWLYCKVFILGR